MDDAANTGHRKQLFYDVFSKSTNAVYFREIYNPLQNNDKFYWFKSALDTTNLIHKNEIASLWKIDDVDFKKSKIQKVKIPKKFKLYNSILNSCTFIKLNDSKNYSIDVFTPFDNSSIQSYNWIRCNKLDWAFVANNEQNVKYVQFKKTSDDTFYIDFLKSSPLGWINKNHKNNGEDSDKYWVEFVLATTIILQDEVHDNITRYKSCIIM